MTPDDSARPTGFQRDERSQHAAPQIEQLRKALTGLGDEIRSQQRRAPDPQRKAGSGTEWGALFDELRRWVGILGMVEQYPGVDDFGMEADYLKRLQPLFDFLYERYWRVQLTGDESLPSKGPVLFVSNRSGLLPWDGMMLSHAIDRSPVQLERPRFLVEDELLRLPFAQAQLARVGGVRACRENLDQLISRGHSVVVFPEGARGAARSFRDRYQVGRFGRGGAIRAAIENRIPLVPVGIVGAEEAYPRLGDTSTLGRLASRDLGLPVLPITPTFPLLGPLGLLPLPSKWVITIGEPISLLELEPDAANDDVSVSHLTEALREEVQRLVERGLEARSSTWL
ncbi:MAG: acyltransferase family protein [Myxococcales bacterium]|nr:acyltransferase family protein [Myxococcales bacterium]MCH7866623.1 acyltransferase family protein [Myxococcales bacterium]